MSLSIDHRNRWARLRFSVIGPLLASPPGKGELQDALQALAAKVWRHPITGADVRFGASTIERWFSAEQIIRRSGTASSREITNQKPFSTPHKNIPHPRPFRRAMS